MPMMEELPSTAHPPERGKGRPNVNGAMNPHPYCDLDERGTVCLGKIIESLNTPISEEHAWALCYQCAKCGNAILGEGNEDLIQRCCLATDTSHVLIQKDGLMHLDTFLEPADSTEGLRSKGPPRTKCSNECKLISALSTVIFSALEFGNDEDEERELNSDLFLLLESMASADEFSERSETDDEGIERDSGESDEDGSRFNFNSIIEICTKRLGSSGNVGSTATADSHYKAVCRALVAEALELSTFLKKVSEGTHQIRTSASFGGPYKGGNHLNTEPEPELNRLNFTDWARLWVQVIQQLRQGVRLKKVDLGPRCPPIEYELTPYEYLMDDIRARRFELKKVMQDGALPHRIKKDAHAIIIEFIRSRPPLKKATDRVLAPAPKQQEGPIELLMKSIREEHKLRPTRPRPTVPLSRRDSSRSRSRRSNSSDMTEIHSINNNKSSSQSPSSEIKNSQVSHPPSNQRRLIKADLDLLYSLNTKDEDDDDDEAFSADLGKECFYGHICPEETQSTPVTPCKKLNEITNGENHSEIRRRHSIANPTAQDEHGETLVTFPFEYTNSSNMVFKTLNYPRASPIIKRRRAKLSHSESKSSLQEEFFQSNHWQTAMECLSLNLEEVVHIRNVLTKAELESLPMDCSLKEDVEKGKVCFLCLKTRFSLLLGPWGNTCKLCKRTVCAKCCSKMRIPTDHFAQVPVSTLSPNISPRDEEKEFPGSKSLTITSTKRDNLTTPVNSTSNLTGRKNSVGSAPTSPNMSRKSGVAETDSESGGQRSISPGGILDEEERDTFGSEQNHGPRSLPSVGSISRGLIAFKRRNFGRGQDDKTDKLKGSLMVVCHDCKAMVDEFQEKMTASICHDSPITFIIKAKPRDLSNLQ